MKNLIIGLFLIAVVVVAAGAWMSEAEPKQLDTTPVKDRAGENLMGVYRDNFMGECNIDGDMFLYCNCAFNYLVNNYSLEHLMSIEENMDDDGLVDGRLPDEVLTAVDHCAGDL